jgi:hypothetical protein
MMLIGALIAFGLLEILILVFAGLMIFTLVKTFGHPGLDNFPSRCPACGEQRLDRVDNGLVGARGLRRHRVFRCLECGCGFREGHDGTLYRLPFDVPGDDDPS